MPARRSTLDKFSLGARMSSSSLGRPKGGIAGIESSTAKPTAASAWPE